MMARSGSPVLLLIGPTGSGKSSFIKSLTDEHVGVSPNKPCTSECKPYTVNVDINGHPKIFIIIDTPGLQDRESTGNNMTVLAKIAATLNEIRPLQVTGAIYFHNIMEGRLTGSALFDLEIFRLICGKRFNPRVAFVTAQWDQIHPDKRDKYESINMEVRRKLEQKYATSQLKIYKRRRDNTESCKEVLENFSLIHQSLALHPLLLMKEVGKWGQGQMAKTKAGKQILQKNTGSLTSGSLCSVL